MSTTDAHPPQAAAPEPADGGLAPHVEVAEVPDEALVVSLFERWNASLATGDPDMVVANYARDGVLHPTLSPEMRTTHAEIRDYFEQFLHRKPRGEVTRRNIYCGPDVAVDSGLCTFDFADGSSVPVRYTFVYVHEDGQWLIMSHHSSRVAGAGPIISNA